MHFVKPNVLHRPGLSISENHGLADKLGLRFLECAKDRGERESYERIVELYVEIAEELEALMDR